MPDEPRRLPSAAPRRDIIVIGASAGGVEALNRVVAGLPPGLPAAVFVVLHLPPHVPSILPELLTHAGPLPAAHPLDPEPIRPGRIYVAPPDRHLLIGPGVVRLSAGPRENHSRPAADPLFRSAAGAYGPRVVGVVLSGALGDGTAGLWEIKERGGVAVVQDPGDAVYPAMPHSAMDQVPVDHVLPVAQIGPLLAGLVRGAAAEPQRGEEGDGAAPEGREQAMSGESQVITGDGKPGEAAVDRDIAAQVAGQRDGTVTVYVCPECGGSLWEANAGQIPRFRCHVGHVYGGEDLLEGYTSEMERSLWCAIRTLRDKANLTRQLARAARRRGAEEPAARYEEKARLDEEHAAAIERMLMESESVNRA